MGRLTLTSLDAISLVQPGDDLGELIGTALTTSGIDLVDGDVIVIAQKIVSKAEDRFRNLNDIEPTSEARQLAVETDKDPRMVQAILDESTEVVRKRKGVLIVRHRRGWIMAQAGIDQSNIEGGQNGAILLLPENPDASAMQLRQSLEDRFQRKLGIIIADSFGRPFRNGTTGIAIGAAGLESFIDQRGQYDLFGRVLSVSTIGHADELAAAASILMGQGNEGRPAVHISGLAPSPHLPASSLIRPSDEDLFK